MPGMWEHGRNFRDGTGSSSISPEQNKFSKDRWPSYTIFQRKPDDVEAVVPTACPHAGRLAQPPLQPVRYGMVIFAIWYYLVSSDPRR